jgi:hypothetical protein
MSGEPEGIGIEDTLAVGSTPNQRAEPSEVGKRIGPYRLLSLIGEGGMGDVWLAEQLEPVRRRVAIKVIKAGMDTKQVVARFDSERQALALMDHPAIARVLDGGTTPEGRSYFVMEHVAGVAINEHCDTHKLSTDERLELMREVCDGVQEPEPEPNPEPQPFEISAQGRNRTTDTGIFSPLLYRLSYLGVLPPPRRCFQRRWEGGQGCHAAQAPVKLFGRHLLIGESGRWRLARTAAAAPGSAAHAVERPAPERVLPPSARQRRPTNR